MAENHISRDILGVPRRAAGRFCPFLRSGDAPGCPLPRVQFWLKTLQMAARTAQMQNAFSEPNGPSEARSVGRGLSSRALTGPWAAIFAPL